jgi:hypothetical protein
VAPELLVQACRCVDSKLRARDTIALDMLGVPLRGGRFHHVVKEIPQDRGPAHASHRLATKVSFPVPGAVPGGKAWQRVHLAGALARLAIQENSVDVNKETILDKCCRPAAQRFKELDELGLALGREHDVDIIMLASDPSEPRIDSPAALQPEWEPGRVSPGQQLADELEMPSVQCGVDAIIAAFRCGADLSLVLMPTGARSARLGGEGRTRMSLRCGRGVPVFRAAPRARARGRLRSACG